MHAENIQIEMMQNRTLKIQKDPLKFHAKDTMYVYGDNRKCQLTQFFASHE